MLLLGEERERERILTFVNQQPAGTFLDDDLYVYFSILDCESYSFFYDIVLKI